MEIPENLLLTPEQVYDILNRHKISLKEAVPVASAMMQILTESSKLIEAEVERRLNALAPPDTVPKTLKVSLEVDPTLVASSTVDLEAYQRARAAHLMASTLLKHLPLSKAPRPDPRLREEIRIETWTWEGVIFVKPEKNENVQT